jgi:inner membrane protein
VCHTLFGAALSSSGLGRRTALGPAALVIGANLPDVDVLAYFGGPEAGLAFRRGWSHGVMALVILPFVLTGLLLLIARRRRRRGAQHDAAPIQPRQLLLLSAIAIISHPVLDTLNTYGVRWLMPFSDRWFYGDVLFIIDPFMWLVLGGGAFWSWRRRRRGAANAVRPVQWAVIVALLYVTGMLASGMTARRIVGKEVERLSGAPVTNVMAGPVPLNPLVRSFVVEQEQVYRVGTFNWTAHPRVAPGAIRIFRRGRPNHPSIGLAVSTPAGRRFLTWARFPSFQVEPSGTDSDIVHILDLRYTDRPGVRFGSVSIPVHISSIGARASDCQAPAPDSLVAGSGRSRLISRICSSTKLRANSKNADP